MDGLSNDEDVVAVGGERVDGFVHVGPRTFDDEGSETAEDCFDLIVMINREFLEEET